MHGASHRACLAGASTSGQLEKQRHWQAVRALGLDGAYVHGWDKRKHPVLIAVDLGRGQPVAIGYVDEYNPQAVRRFLAPLVQRLGVSVIVTDDLASFRQVTQKLGVEHQVCQFHVRRWVGRTLHDLRETVPQEWLWVLDEVKDLQAELPPDGSRRLYELWKSIPERRIGQAQPLSPLSQLRALLLRLKAPLALLYVLCPPATMALSNNFPTTRLMSFNLSSP